MELHKHIYIYVYTYTYIHTHLNQTNKLASHDIAAVIGSNMLPVTLSVLHGCNAFAKDKQGRVDVSCLFQPLPKRLGFIASFRASQVTKRESGEVECLVNCHYKKKKTLQEMFACEL